MCILEAVNTIVKSAPYSSRIWLVVNCLDFCSWFPLETLLETQKVVTRKIIVNNQFICQPVLHLTHKLSNFSKWNQQSTSDITNKTHHCKRIYNTTENYLKKIIMQPIQCLWKCCSWYVNNSQTLFTGSWSLWIIIGSSL